MSFSSANTLPMESSSTQCSEVSAIVDQWQVQYARFVNSCTAAASVGVHPLLAPFQNKCVRRHWISTDCASLKVRYQGSVGKEYAVIEIDFRSLVLEEHCVSKMHFSQPQLMCLSGFPPRGSRFIIVSYKDSVGQIQKFALGFSTFHEADKFMDIVKVNIGNGIPIPLRSSKVDSQLSSQAEVIPPDEEVYRPVLDWENPTSVDVTPQLLLPCPELNLAQHTISSELVKDHETGGNTVSFPPNFTELLKGCQMEALEDKPKNAGKDLKNQLMHYLQRTSFKELLATVENVVSQLGDDTVL